MSADSQMKVIEIFTDCITEPIRLACFPSHNLTRLSGVIVSDNQPIPECPTYELHVSCTKANVDTILDIASFQDLPHGKGGRITLAEYRKPFCVKGEDCPLSNLPIQELFIPIVIDELATNEPLVDTHWDS